MRKTRKQWPTAPVGIFYNLFRVKGMPLPPGTNPRILGFMVAPASHDIEITWKTHRDLAKERHG